MEIIDQPLHTRVAWGVVGIAVNHWGRIAQRSMDTRPEADLGEYSAGNARDIEALQRQEWQNLKAQLTPLAEQ